MTHHGGNKMSDFTTITVQNLDHLQIVAGLEEKIFSSNGILSFDNQKNLSRISSSFWFIFIL